jgi:hypothetical protein
MWISANEWKPKLDGLVMPFEQPDPNIVTDSASTSLETPKRAPNKETTTYSVKTDATECTRTLRIKRLQEVCRNNNWHTNIFSGNSTALLGHFQVDAERRIIYCNIPKASSTSFLFLMTVNSLLDLEDVNPFNHQPHQRPYLEGHGINNMQQYTVKEAKYRFKNYYTFLVIRHPFSRLLASYRYLTHGVRRNLPSLSAISDYFGGTVSVGNLTLTQFLELLVKNPDTFVNVHWRDYYKFCFPCSVTYDHIIKLETLSQDILPVIRRMFGSQQNFSGLPNLTQGKKYVAPELRDTSTSFRDQPEDVISNLMRIYDKDFQLFGYNWTSAGGMQCGGFRGLCGPDARCI